MRFCRPIVVYPLYYKSLTIPVGVGFSAGSRLYWEFDRWCVACDLEVMHGGIQGQGISATGTGPVTCASLPPCVGAMGKAGVPHHPSVFSPRYPPSSETGTLSAGECPSFRLPADALFLGHRPVLGRFDPSPSVTGCRPTVDRSSQEEAAESSAPPQGGY